MAGFPQPSRWRARPPTGSSTAAGMPTGTRARLPNVFHRVPPPVATWNGEGILAASGAPVALAQFTGGGLLAAVGGAAGLAGFTAEGFLVEIQNEGVASFTGAATLSAPAIAVAVAQFTAAGTLLGPAYARGMAAFTGVGGLTATEHPTATASFTAAGTLAAAGSTFVAGQMVKASPAYSLTAAFTTVPNWTADTATYPGSAISGNALVANGGGTGIVSTSLTFSNGGIARTVTVRLKVGATVVATSAGTSIPGAGGTITLSSPSTAISPGDLITVEAMQSAGTIAVTASTANYVRVVPV